MSSKEHIKAIDQHYINGKFVKSRGSETLNLINPSNERVIGRVTLGNAQDAREAIAAAKEAFKTFSKTTVEERIRLLERLRDAVAAREDDLIRVCIEEYGAPRPVAEARARLTAGFFQLAMDALKEFPFSSTIGTARVVRQPVGVVGMITPWNSSTTQITSKIAHAVAAGCTCVVKPSEISALQTQVLLECFHEAGLPAGVINIVNGLGEVVGTELTRNPGVAMISFTGSTNTGKIIYRESMDTMKRIVLELSGKSPNIILEDADFNRAIPGAVMRCFMNNGQACIAGTRLLVPEERLDEVKSLIKQTIENIQVGNPSEKDTFIGPMATEKQYNNVQRYIQLGLEEGAELVAGGTGHPEGLDSGYYVKPTVFANVNRNMTIAQEEIFGPVLSVMTYRTEQEAIEIANDTRFGLGGYISSSDLQKAREVASQIDAGVILINDSAFEMNAPFGGFKQSGIGREYGPLGMEEYLELKTIVG